MTSETDCGGDCVFCMAVAGDPECVTSVHEMAKNSVRLKGHLRVAIQIIEGFVEALDIDPETSKIGLVSESSGEEMGGATIAELLVVLKGAAK